MVMSVNKMPKMNNTPEIAFKSLFRIACMPYLESPGKLNTNSTTKAAANNEIISNDITEMVGIKDSLDKYLVKIRF
jgi:hypothetical protein